MAITAGDFASATDPFLMAFNVAYTSTLMDWANYRIRIYDSEGLLNGIVDKELQDIFWQNDVDPDKAFPAAATQTNGTGSFLADYEFGSFDQDVGGGTFASFTARNRCHADPKDAYVFLAGRANGAVIYSLFAYVAYTWYERDPAQILFSWIGHHLDNSVLTMKDYIDQDTFSAASDYYDSKPIGMVVSRESGKTIAEQTKDLFEHTADFLVIAPSGATNTVKLKIITRGALTERTTPINLDGDSVASYSVRPTDRYRIDRLDHRFGNPTMVVGGLAADDAGDYMVSFPVSFPHTSRNLSSQKAGPSTAANKVEVSLPLHQTRDRVLNHLDLLYWKDDQDEVEIEFADWTHFNFEAGDVVPVVGGGYTGTEKFLVVEKRLDLDDMMATCRLLQLRGADGMTPKQADAANLIFSLRPNTLGHFVDGTAAFPLRVGYKIQPKNLDRWWDESGRFSHATQMDRGIGGPAGANPTPPQMTLDTIARWPVLDFDGTSALKQGNGASGSKIVGPYTAATSDFTFYAVVRVDDTAAAVAELWAYSYLGTAFGIRFASGVPKYTSGGVTYGTGSALAGWQIVVWTLKSAAASTVRRNGVELFNSGTFAKVQLSPLGDFSIAISATGSLFPFNGAIAEMHCFAVAHALATTQAIEAHLSEKYGITI